MNSAIDQATNTTNETAAIKSTKGGWLKFLAIETATSALANTLFSIAFVFLIFHGHARVPIHGSGGLIFDAIPQSFMVALMGTLISPLLTRRRIAAGTLPILSNRLARASQVWLRAFLFALAAMFAGLAAQAALLPVLLPADISFNHVLIFKAVYGACLAILVTPIALVSAFRFSPSAKAHSENKTS